MPDSLVSLSGDKYHLATACFDAHSPNIAFIKSIIEKKIPGKIFVDCLKNPQSSCLITEGPFGFVSKNFDINQMHAIAQCIANKTDFKLMVDSTHLERKRIVAIDRVYMSLNRNKMITDVGSVSGFSLHCIDDMLFEKCLWKGLMQSIYGTKENYLTHAGGYCLLHNNRVVSEAHAIISDDFAELGVITDYKFRNLGLSLIVCQALLLDCLDRGFPQARWSCDLGNTPSFKLATKLGFEYSCQYHALGSAEINSLFEEFIGYN